MSDGSPRDRVARMSIGSPLDRVARTSSGSPRDRFARGGEGSPRERAAPYNTSSPRSAVQPTMVQKNRSEERESSRASSERKGKVIMETENSHGCFEHVNMKGRNVGASMYIRQRSGVCSAERLPNDQECCCINIYVNNNIQGVNNSILFGSQVRMRDPGVSLYFGDMKLHKSWYDLNRRTSGGLRESFCLILLLLLVIIVLAII
ncbi:hypothetical protein ACFE04_000239 [Oxalis oulophora]